MNEELSGRPTHEVDRHVGVMLRAKRRALGITQTDLAEALGVTFQQIQKYERGANRVSASKLYEAARVLQSPVSFFFEGLEQPDACGEAPVEVIADFLDERATRELVAAFKAMSPLQRKRLLALAKAMADPDEQAD